MEIIDDLLETYHSSLTSCLVNYGYSSDLYPLEVLRKEYMSKGAYQFCFGVLHTQVTKAKIIL